MKEILLQDLTAAFRAELERALDGTNQFFIGNSYPVAKVSGQVVVDVLPQQKLPAPFPVVINFEYGTSLQTALDKIRHNHGLDVLRPMPTKGGLVVNQPVEMKPDSEPA